MATRVRCLLCLDKLNETTKEGEPLIETKYDIFSPLIPKSDEEETINLGQELVKHLQAHHSSKLKMLSLLQAHWNGFNIMKYFETEAEDSKFEKDKEVIRERMCEEVMYGAPVDEEDDEFEDEDDDFEDTGGGDLEEDDEDDCDEGEDVFEDDDEEIDAASVTKVQ